MKIDIFNHFLPPAYMDALRALMPDDPLVRLSERIRPLWDLDERLRMIERWPDLRQVLSLGQPTPELVAGPADAVRLARIANDGMAAACQARPDRFPAFVASLPMNNPDAAIEEMDRAIGVLGAAGVQVMTSVNGRPLDAPEYFPIFERLAAHHRKPLWLHPYKPPTRSDYPEEAHSEYEIWVVLGWPHESSVAMARMVFAEFFDRLPDFTVITHHCGATIPYLLGRVGPMWDELGERSNNARYKAIRARMADKGLRPIDYFRRFFGDTVVGGSVAGLRCGLDFFGPDRVVFASDFPFGPENGMWFLRENIAAVEGLRLPESERDGIYFRNALRLLGRAG